MQITLKLPESLVEVLGCPERTRRKNKKIKSF